jgi:hypothetical protein
VCASLSYQCLYLYTDQLEWSLNQQAHLIAHFSYIREVLHRPVATFMNQMSRTLATGNSVSAVGPGVGGSTTSSSAGNPAGTSSSGNSNGNSVVENRKARVLDMQVTGSLDDGITVYKN